jgi:hypothetical protein
VSVCEAFADGYFALPERSDVILGACTLDAVLQLFSETGSVDPAECRQFRDDCVATGAPNALDPGEGAFSEGPDCAEEDVADDLEGCDATVGQMETCMTGMVEAFASIFVDLDCERLSTLADDQDALADALTPDNPLAVPPPACDAVMRRCPDLFQGGSESSDGSGSGSAGDPTPQDN